MRAGLLLACVVCVATRLPAFRGGALSDDEAIYATMAKEIVAGGVMYREAVDHKPPGLAYTYAAMQAIAGDAGAWTAVHLLGLLAALGTIVALFGIAGQLFSDARVVALPGLLYALASAAKQPVDGLAVNGELLMNLPLALAVLLALSPSPSPSRSWAGAGARRLALDVAVGILIGVAALYKYQASVLGIALMFLVDPGTWTRTRTWLRPAAWLAGFVLPFALAMAWFAHRGALHDAIAWGLRFNGRYLAAGPSFWNVLERLAIQLVGVVIPSALLYVAGVGSLFGRAAPFRRAGPAPAAAEGARRMRFLKAWGFVSLLCVTLGGRFFGHYFLQAELPLALLAAPPVARWLGRAPRTAVAMLAFPPLVFLAISASPSLSDRIFERGAPDYAGIGAAVRRATGPDESIWVWGNAPQIYSAADRRAGTRFVFCNYLTGLSPATPSETDPTVDPAADAVAGAWAPLIADLDRRRPTLVLDTSEPHLKAYGKFPIRRYPALATYMKTHYRRDGDAAGVPLYRRKD
jgi:hypothetical protein